MAMRKTTSTNRFFVKSEKNFYDERRPFLLSIQDPQDPENDLGRNSYAWRSVKAAFEHAFTVITAPVGASKEVFFTSQNRKDGYGDDEPPSGAEGNWCD